MTEEIPLVLNNNISIFCLGSDGEGNILISRNPRTLEQVLNNNISVFCSYISYISVYTLTCYLQHVSLPVSNTINSADQLRYGGKHTFNTMKITDQLLELYNVGVNAGLDLKLNLWTRDGDEFFSFSRLPGFKHQKPRTRRSRRWRNYGRARHTPKDVRSPLQAAGPPQVCERSQPQVAGPRLVDESFQPQVAGPPPGA